MNTLTHSQKNAALILAIGLLFAGIVAFAFNSSVVCGWDNSPCGNGNPNGKATGPGSNTHGGANSPSTPSNCLQYNRAGNCVISGGNNNPPPPPPPPPCYFTTSASVVQAGTTTIQLSWTPAPTGAVSLQRSHNGSNKTLTAPARATGYSDTVRAVAGKSISYSLSYNARSNRGRDEQHQCSGSVTVVTKLTECNDAKDNADAEDSLADRFDPGCHTDGNPNNDRTYDPLDESETNPPADMVPSVSAPSSSEVGRSVSVTAGAENISATYAEANSLVFGWRNTSAGAPAPRCGSGIAWLAGNRCFTHDGKKYSTLSTYSQSYNGKQKRTALPRSFRPTIAGRYEVCAIADYDKAVNEGATGEANNSVCTIVNVDTEDPRVPPPGPVITGSIELIVSPGRVRRGTATTVTWNTNGREQCTITGTNGHVINLTGESSAASEPTPPITSETTYVMVCADDGARAEGKVGILPVLQEI